MQTAIKNQAAVKGRKKTKDVLTPYIFILPVFIFITIFILVPFGTAIIKSFYRYDAAAINEFVGFKNYVRLFTQDKKFIISFGNLLYMGVGLVICFASAVMGAKMVFSLPNQRFQLLFRNLFTVPIVVPGTVIILMWKFLYYPNIGVFARVLAAFGQTAPNFLGSEQWVKPSIILIGFPWISGLNFLVSYAALQGIDSSVLEAACIDGASGWKRFMTVELPAIMPQLKSLFVLAIIGLVRDYERYLLLTAGGPNNASLVPGLHMYQMAFGLGENMYGYACAISVVLFLMTFIIAFLMLRRRRED